jgi:calcineurin-like phosphoesterase family protein
MSVFMIGCLHLGHENMAKRRGWGSSEEHDEHLIQEWNKVISKRDKVFILGDVTMESMKPYPKLLRLKGFKHVVLGNHDMAEHIPEMLKYVTKVCGVVKYQGCWLSHIPVHPMDFEFRIRLNIHAHVHHNTINDPRYFNVDAHKLGYAPIEFQNILDLRLKPYGEEESSRSLC